MSGRRRFLACGLVLAGICAGAAQAQPACPGVAANLFPAQSWQPPAPPSPPPSRPEAPRAPPLPFKYLGQLQDGDAVTVFLEYRGLTQVVRAGDTLDGLWHVAEVVPARATFVYLPLNESLTLTLRARP